MHLSQVAKEEGSRRVTKRYKESKPSRHKCQHQIFAYVHQQVKIGSVYSSYYDIKDNRSTRHFQLRKLFYSLLKNSPV